MYELQQYTLSALSKFYRAVAVNSNQYLNIENSQRDIHGGLFVHRKI